jgi:hypothetical protein
LPCSLSLAARTSSGHHFSDKPFIKTFVSSTQPLAIFCPHCLQLLEISRVKHLRQKVCPHAIVTGCRRIPSHIRHAKPLAGDELGPTVLAIIESIKTDAKRLNLSCGVSPALGSEFPYPKQSSTLVALSFKHASYTSIASL